MIESTTKDANTCSISPDNLEWTWSSFDNISIEHLYKILDLRQRIFIVEQNVPYIDIDGKDLHCRHLTGFLGSELLAYMRIVPVGLFAADGYSFGRVVTRSDIRGTGIGREMVCRGIEYLDKIRNGTSIKISSQLYLKEFYASFGFISIGEPYIEDKILHISMVRY